MRAATELYGIIAIAPGIQERTDNAHELWLVDRIIRYCRLGFLAVLAVVKGSGALRHALLIGCGVFLTLGFVARVALAAHWPSDVIISYYLGLFWAAFLIRFASLE